MIVGSVRDQGLVQGSVLLHEGARHAGPPMTQNQSQRQSLQAGVNTAEVPRPVGQVAPGSPAKGHNCQQHQGSQGLVALLVMARAALARAFEKLSRATASGPGQGSATCQSATGAGLVPPGPTRLLAPAPGRLADAGGASAG